MISLYDVKVSTRLGTDKREKCAKLGVDDVKASTKPNTK